MSAEIDASQSEFLTCQFDMRQLFESWIPRGSNVAIVDVPVNRNAGDLFIHAATARLLADAGCRVVYRAGVRDYRSAAARRCITPGVVIVGLGGGNFGDLYPRYQALRERVVHDFPDNRIVILPQTIHFRHEDGIERCAALLTRHADLRIAARDARSLAVARRFTPHAQMCPDVVDATGLAVLGAEASPVAAPSAGTLYLLRRDGERRTDAPPAPTRIDRPGRQGRERTMDWPDLFPEYAWRLAIAALLMPFAASSVSARLHEAWASYATQVLGRAVARMRQAERVVTDRLHGAIVARLAGRPVTLVDNAHGKLSAYYDAWWRDEALVTLARDVHEGRDAPEAHDAHKARKD